MADELNVDAAEAESSPRRRQAVVRAPELVAAVRAQSLLELGPDGRASLAWQWALTGTRPAPISLAAAPGSPPPRAEILAEARAPAQTGTVVPGIPGDYQDQVGDARRILAWLAGLSDEIPLDDDNRGRFIGARDDFARTDEEMNQVLSWARAGLSRDAGDAEPGASDRVPSRTADVAWLRGVRDLLEWVLRTAVSSPLCHRAVRLPSAYDLTYEVDAAVALLGRLRAAAPPIRPGNPERLAYAEAIRAAISWLRGETTEPPVDAQGNGPYTRQRNSFAPPSVGGPVSQGPDN